MPNQSRIPGSPSAPGRPIMMVAAGHDHTIALSEAGAVWTWGRGGQGRLGLDSRDNHNLPTEISTLSYQGVVSVAAGNGYSMALAGTEKEKGGEGEGSDFVLWETDWETEEVVVRAIAVSKY